MMLVFLYFSKCMKRLTSNSRLIDLLDEILIYFFGNSRSLIPAL